MLSDKAKVTIDGLTKDELRKEIDKGTASRFQGEKFAYMRTRYKILCEQEDLKKRQQDVRFKEDELVLAGEANRLSHSANRRSTIAICIAAFAVLLSLVRLVFDLVK